MPSSGLQVMDVSCRGWRLSEETVEEKVEELKELVNETDERRTTVTAIRQRVLSSEES